MAKSHLLMQSKNKHSFTNLSKTISFRRNKMSHKLKKGCVVKIHGLKGATHLNGEVGKLIEFHSKGYHSGRWVICLNKNNGEKIAVKPEKLKIFHQPAIKPDDRKKFEDNPFDEMFRAIESGQLDPDEVEPVSKDDSWANGLSTTDQYEWLSNCYQMRCDDDYVWGGCNLHGAYLPEATPESLRDDFMTFCYLACQNQCVPGNWNWEAFLERAAEFVVFAFEKSDARKRWGGENIFDAMLGGRSLRYTAEKVYCSACQDPNDSPQAEKAKDIVTNHPSNKVLNQIGGRKAWEKFLRGVKVSRRFNM